MSETDAAAEARRQEALKSFRARQAQRPVVGQVPPRADSSGGPVRPAPRPPAPKTTPWWTIFLGSLAQLIGGIVYVNGQGDSFDGSGGNGFVMFLGASAVLTGVIYMAIGVIAEGMRMGARWVAHDVSLRD